MDTSTRRKRRKWSSILTTGVLCFGCLLFLSSGPVNAAKLYVADADFDGVDDAIDNCLGLGNPLQKDLDGDGIGNLCEPGKYKTDTDGDGIDDAVDNCVDIPNPLQTDWDKDGIGIMCEPGVGNTDTDGDLILDEVDNCPNDSNPLQKDLDKDNVGTVCDPDESVFRNYNIAIFFENKETTSLARKVLFEENNYTAYLRSIDFETMTFESMVNQRNDGGPVKGCLCHTTERVSRYPEVGTRRAVIGSEADFRGVVDEVNKNHVEGPVEAMDCIACHYTGDHQGGVVKLINADAPWVIYDYDPNDRRSLEPFCWSCHDSDGSTSSFGTTPFSDGESVPAVSHGNRECTSCHGIWGPSLNAHRPVYYPFGSSGSCENLKTPWRKMVD